MKLIESNLEHYWICFDCAEKKGGKWPRGHVATCGWDTCPYCNKKGSSIAPIVDFDWPDRDLSAWRD